VRRNKEEKRAFGELLWFCTLLAPLICFSGAFPANEKKKAARRASQASNAERKGKA